MSDTVNDGTEFALIDFRDSLVGRQAYIQGSTLAVWEVVMVAREFGLDPVATAEHLGWTALRVRAALNYAAAHAYEIAVAVAANDAVSESALAVRVPAVEGFQVRSTGA